MDLYAWHAPGTFLKGWCVVGVAQFHATFLGYNALVLMNPSVLDALELTMLAAKLVADLGDCRMLPMDKSCAQGVWR
ncbi:hypothetical protein [Aeromonas sp.]|uniref:hypothetical protein n=1 Tax=Aeromonas sp. TaxID=647 RepID=UPI0029155403|nr:hypothetical protein [Aeromonas sp.]MDU7581823.1 hypothetical protein [Aeromonas sp.]